MDTYSLSGWISNRKTLQAYFPVFAVTIAFILSYFVVAAHLCICVAIVSDFTSNLTENDRFISRFIRNLSQLLVDILIVHISFINKTHQGVLARMSTFRFFIGLGLVKSLTKVSNCL